MITSFIILSILPLSIVGTFSYLNAEQTVKDKVGSYSGKMVEQLAINIDSTINEFERIYKMINTNVKLMEKIQTVDSLNSFDKVKIFREIDNDVVSIVAANTFIKSANIIKNTGEN
ncbi:MAG: methyl-accepting chemotaxis protein, partial [Defluviitaleaceae bacterium]|nr:methyl-accepting chemotaxis protein [Defluviitaleaceae bacterium]